LLNRSAPTLVIGFLRLAPTNLIVMPAEAGIQSGGPSAYAPGPPVLRYDIHTCPTVPRAQATRALSGRTRHEYRVSKHRRLTNLSLYAILATDQSSLFVFTRWCAPVHRGTPVFMLTIGRLLPNRPLSRCSFLRSATGAPGFLRRKERSSLIIPCKKQQKQRGAVSGGPVRKIVHPGALLRGRRKGACGSRPFGWHH
jgi:hypothetical protein